MVCLSRVSRILLLLISIVLLDGGVVPFALAFVSSEI